ncbi:MAG: OmpA family protein [Gammaproteobacteria bacterium]|nr:OmpA family protein [Gammaproteobacteria bacterium]
MAKNAGAAVPAWMVTFADLMALMMTFFVLLYSFSSIDEQKYKMIAASMAKGFGSVLTQTKQPRAVKPGPPAMIPSPMTPGSRSRNNQRPSQAAQRNEQMHEEIKQSLESEIAEGIISVETSGNSVIIRFPEEIAFPPGSDDISDEIMPILKRVTNALQDTPGTVMVSGHTDDRPIKSATFSSNWELSTDRAVEVIHRLQQLGTIESERLTAVGYGSTRPIAPNDTPENRAKNRRVEIAIVQEQ